jgi:hypothetical protein
MALFTREEAVAALTAVQAALPKGVESRLRNEHADMLRLAVGMPDQPEGSLGTVRALHIVRARGGSRYHRRASHIDGDIVTAGGYNTLRLEPAWGSNRNHLRRFLKRKDGTFNIASLAGWFTDMAEAHRYSAESARVNTDNRERDKAKLAELSAALPFPSYTDNGWGNVLTLEPPHVQRGYATPTLSIHKLRVNAQHDGGDGKFVGFHLGCEISLMSLSMEQVVAAIEAIQRLDPLAKTAV